MSFTEVTDGQGVLLSSTASTTNNLHPLGPNAQALDQQTHPGDQDYQILPTDRYVSTDQSLSGARTWRLPAANSVTVGWQVTVADSFGACNLTTSITVAPSGTDTINLVASAKLNQSPYSYVKVRSDGVTNWTVIDQFPLTGTAVGDTNYQILSTDTFVYSTAAITATRTWRLPAANAVAVGWTITVADSKGGTAGLSQALFVATSGSDTIASGVSPTLRIYYPFGFVVLRSDGVSDWSILGGDTPTLMTVLNVDTNTYDAYVNAGLFLAEPSIASLANGRNDNVTATAPQLRISQGPTAAFSISGIVPQTPAIRTTSGGQMLWIQNATSVALTLLNENANSTAANRLHSPSGADVVVAATGMAQLAYDSTRARWLIDNIYDGTQPDQAGWQYDANAWTYASATTFTVANDPSGYLTKGTKVSYNDGSVDYGHVVSVSGSGPYTVTLIANADYSIANAALTAPRYSYADNPQGFPSWFNWTPTFAGWSANPSNAVYRYSVNGTQITVAIRQTTAGTSNNTNHTISAPVAAATITNMIWGNPCRAQDNGVIQTGNLIIASAGTLLGANGIIATNASTAAGNSNILTGTLVYEF